MHHLGVSGSHFPGWIYSFWCGLYVLRNVLCYITECVVCEKDSVHVDSFCLEIGTKINLL